MKMQVLFIVLTRKQVEELQEALESQKIESVIYHAGLSNKEKKRRMISYLIVLK